MTEQGTHQAQREHIAALHAHPTRYELAPRQRLGGVPGDWVGG